MAVTLATDIVMDVARAVGSEGVEAARAALTRKASAPAATAAADKARDPYVKFESMVLGSFVQSMLPKNADSVYGGGLSGDMWQSLMAQEMGKVIAESGGIGIAERMLRDHYVEGKDVVPLGPRADSATRTDSERSNLLSVAMVQEIQRSLTQSMLSGDASGDKPKG